MKRQLYILLTLCILHFAPCTLSAQTYNAFVGDLQGGFSGKQLGANAALHLGYGLRYRHFVFRLSAGVGYDYLQTPMPDNDLTTPALDSELFQYLKKQQYTNRTDRSHLLEVSVPVLLGAEWQYFYFLLGATPAYRVYGQTRVTALVTSQGEYDMFYDPFADMPNHGYTTVPYQSEPVAMPMGFLLYASAEIGVPIGQHFRLGAFADYPVVNTTQPAPYRVGLRLTVWTGKEKKKHYPCQCMQDNHKNYRIHDSF